MGSGVQCDVRSIFIVGNREVSKGVIRRGITFREGMAYSREALRESQRQLYRSGIFRSVVVGVPDTASKTSPVDVAIRVSERPLRRIRVGGGFDTEEKFKGSLEWTHRNFLGGARQFQVASSVSSLNRRAQVGLRQPYFGGSKNWLNLGAFAERETVERFQQDEAGANLSLERNLTPYFGGVLFLEAGNVAKEFDAFDLRDLKWAVGTGIRYLSPIGPVRFDVGIRLSDDGSEPQRVYHLSLGQAF